MLSVELAFGNNCPLAEIRFGHSLSYKQKEKQRHVLRVHFIKPHGDTDNIKEFASLQQAAEAISAHIDEWFGNTVGADDVLRLLRAAIRSEPLGEWPTRRALIRHAITF